jgi:hypothetical protein
MLTNWKSHCYIAPVQFDRSGDALIIQTDSENSRGSWFAWWDAPIRQGEKYQLLGTHDAGVVKVLFYRTQTDFMFSVSLEPGEFFHIPEDATMIRVDCRLWNEKGRAVFQGIKVLLYEEPEEPEPDENPILPIPEPDLMQKHHVTGYKWGRNIFVMVHGDEEAIIPPDWGDAYEVKGTQTGRRLDLEIGNMITAEEPAEKEQEQ